MRQLAVSTVSLPNSPISCEMAQTMVTDPHSGHLTPQGLLFAGGVAAMPAALLTTPLDVIKTRIQATRMSTGDWKVNKELKVRERELCAVGSCQLWGALAWSASGTHLRAVASNPRRPTRCS